MKPEHVAWFRRAFLRHGPTRYAVMQRQDADRKYDDHPGALTDQQIRDHLDGRSAYAVPTAENGLASLLPLDIDAGGENAARALLDAAAARGLWAFAQVDSARGRGYVWIPFDDLASAERLRQLGDQLINPVQQPGWKIENRATNEDTRLPFARHRWTGRRGVLIHQGDSAGPLVADLDGDDFADQLATFVAVYRENPTDQLPAPPASPAALPTTPTGNQGVTIARYNADTDLASLLESYGARKARGQGARLYFCPLHSDDHASLLVSKDGERCHCLSQGSDCPLSGHQHDAFNVFCIAEQLTTRQALRRLNGLPDDPEPNTGSPPKTPPRTPPGGPGKAKDEKTACATPKTFSSLGASQEPHQPPTRTTARDGRKLPKTCRRLLDIIAEHPGGYIRGKYTLARLLDVDPRTVQRSLRRLEAERLIERQERGRDGQTDVYRLARGDTEGRHLPPTVELEIYTHTEALEAERGGQATPGDESQAGPADSGQAYRLALPVPEEGDELTGPGGAFVVAGGAAYVPPEAADWYSGLLQLAARAAPPTPEREPEQAELPAPEQIASYDTPTVQEPPRKKRRRNASHTRYVDPGRLHGRIIAAERKAEKLERTGRDADRRQARAIRRQADQLKRQLEAMREAPPQAEDEPEAEASAPPPRPTTAPPSSSLPGVDWRYLEVLARAGEMQGIENHCRLYRGDVALVCAELRRRGHLAATGAP